jgi:hypothetical protein
MARRLPPRDPTTGRFRKRPPTPLPDDLLSQLGQARKPFQLMADVRTWRLLIPMGWRLPRTSAEETPDDA